MGYIKNFSDFLNESKSTEIIIKNLTKHLAFDKDIVKYLNTSRSKREMGWRELLAKKLKGSKSEYITYITKNMVADYNPKITGPTKIKIDDGDFDNPDEVEISRLSGLSTSDKIEDINRRLEDVEDVLGINPDNKETLDKSKKTAKNLDFDVIFKDETDDDNEEE